jgi:hypothetical protein
MSAERVSDLSKSLIETVGILVSLLAISSFFYLEGLAEIIDSNLTVASEVAAKDEQEQRVILELNQMIHNSKKSWDEKCEKCKGCEVLDKIVFVELSENSV